MSVAFRIRAWPRAAATGAAIAVFLAGGNSGAPHHDGTNHYQAGVIGDPRFEASVSFTDDGWAAQAVPSVGAIGWAPAEPAKLDQFTVLYWRDATIEVDRIKDGVITRRLTGTIAEATVSDGKLIITCADLSKVLDKPVTAATFAGTGGIEGGDFAIGRAKRRSFGRVWNVEGRLLDKVNNIYEFGDPAFPLQGCTALRDMGRAGPLGIIAWQGSIVATLNALKAANPDRGGGLFAPSIACAKWWTQPAGPLTADLQGEAAGYAETAAGIAAQLLGLAQGPTISNLAAANALRPAVCGLHIGDNSETTSAALDRLLQRVTLGWRLTPAGAVEIWSYTFTGPVETLNAIFISRESTIQPVKSRQVGYKKNERVHGDGEISAAVQASDVVYEDGTTAEEMKPAEPGATDGMNPTEKDEFEQLKDDQAAADQAISNAESDIADLIATYGSTASAAASATAAANSASAAQGYAGTASTAATNATNAKEQASTASSAAQAARSASEAARDTAIAQAQGATDANSAAQAAKSASELARNQAQIYASNANGSATAAAGSASTANTSATNAGNSATAAAASALSASSSYAATAQALVGTYPQKYVSGSEDIFSTATTGNPATIGSAYSNATSADGLPVRQSSISSSTNDWAPKWTVPAVDGRVYEFEYEFEIVSTSGGAVNAGLLRSMDASYSSIGAGVSTSYSAVGIYTHKVLYSRPTAPVGGNTWSAGAVWLRPFLRTNAGGGAITAQFRRISVTDVTAREAAKNSASASASSASAADTSATNAGLSASAAQLSATNASTSAGNASTFANNASTSASAAAGSASAASISAGAAANSATNAGNSASAASGSASNAGTSATNAGNSASAAAASAVSASSAYDGARLTAAAMLPSDFVQDGAFWTTDAGGRPATRPLIGSGIANYSFVDVAGIGRVAQVAGDASANRYLMGVGVVSIQPGRTYKITAYARLTTANAGSVALYVQYLDANYSTTASATITTSSMVQNQWYSLGPRVISGDTAIAAGHVYFRSGVRLNAAASADTMQLAYVHVEDITESTSAASSASAASTSASSAGTSADNAQISASAAQQSAVTASTQANNASNSAGAALVSQNAAAGSASSASTAATNAGSYATAANASNVQAALTAAYMMPSDFQQDGKFWFNGFNGLPATLTPIVANSTFSFANVAGVGRVIQATNGGNIDISAIGTINAVAGRTYRFTAYVRRTAGSSAAIAQLYSIGIPADGAASVGNIAVDSRTLSSGSAWYALSGTFTPDAQIAAGGSFFRPMLRIATSSSVTVQIAYIRVEDITSEAAAAGYANAASNSASTASASQTAAGNSASAAQNSATSAATSAGNAQTYAGNASTSASNAATSASNASGSANTASTQASNAATSATNAGNSATAASNSASAAGTSASNAGNSASAAAASAISASSTYTNLVNSVNAAPILPFDFRDGVNAWTDGRSGNPTAVSPSNGTIVEGDSVYGRALDIVVSAVGGGLYTRGVVPAIAGRYYKVTAAGRYLAGDGSYQAATHCVSLSATYSDSISSGSATTVSTGQDFIVSDMWSNTATNGARAWASNAVYLRFGFRNNQSESGGATVRIGYIKVEDVTDQLLASVSASAAAVSASNASTSASNAANSASSATASANTATTKANDASSSAGAAATSASNASSSSSAAGSSASAAANSATAAAGSAGNAASSATTAQGHASNASSSAAAAASSATLAATFSTGGGNLLTNTEFAVDTSGWQTNANGISGGVWGIDGAGAAWVPTLSHVLSIYQPNATSSGYLRWYQDVDIEASAWYEAQARFAAHRCTVTMYLQFFDAFGTSLSTPSVANATPGGGGTTVDSYTLYSVKAQAPSNAVRARIILQKNATLSGNSDSWGLFLRPQIRKTYAEAPQPTQYAAGNGAAVAASMSASIATNATAIATASSALAQLTSEVRAGSSNMLPNGGFENGLAGWSAPGWAVTENSPGWGSYASNGANAANGSYTLVDSDLIPAEANVGFTASADLLYFITSGAGRAYLELLWYNGTSLLSMTTSTGKDANFSFDVSGASRQALKVTGVAPAGTTQMRARVTFYKASGTVTQRGIRQVKLERGTVATAYTGEAAVTQSFSALSTLSTQYASLSSTVSAQGATVSQQATTIASLQGNVNTLFAQYVLNVDVNGRVAGMKLANNGSASSIVFRADLARFESPSPGTGALEWKDQAIQMRDAAGKLRIFMGYRA